MEEWRDVAGYEGLYQVSNLGKIKMIKRGRNKILIGRKRGKGYISVTLTKKGCPNKDYYVHRLVAAAFIPNPLNLPQINHINFNKADNSVSNLEWCDNKYNAEHRATKGFSIPKKQKRYQKRLRTTRQLKPIFQYSLDGQFIKKWSSLSQIQKELGIWHSNIADCCKGISKYSHGFVWSYEKREDFDNPPKSSP